MSNHPVAGGSSHSINIDLTRVAEHFATGSGSGMDDFAAFYTANFHPIARQLYAYLGSAAEAQDVTQEAFCRALARWKSLVAYDNPAAWVARVAWHVAISQQRRRRVAAAFLRRQRDPYTAGPTPDRVRLVEALAQLPLNQRRVFVLRHLADMSVQAIADQERMPVGTVKSLVHRARVALSVLLGDNGEEHGRD